MSNNKQSSVEWLHEQLTLTWYDFNSSKDLLEQAKAMHKEEIENAYFTCYEEYTAEGKHWEMGMNPKETFKQYYNETFNSDEA
jgi:hypothetical protein